MMEDGEEKDALEAYLAASATAGHGNTNGKHNSPVKTPVSNGNVNPSYAPPFIPSYTVLKALEEQEAERIAYGRLSLLRAN